jgi:hypothetical protein
MLWVVWDIKIKISCLVGKLKPTQLICVVLPVSVDRGDNAITKNGKEKKM